jgi:hypothetical protein
MENNRMKSKLKGIITELPRPSTGRQMGGATIAGYTDVKILRMPKAPAAGTDGEGGTDED